jgi:hypothetical protein
MLDLKSDRREPFDRDAARPLSWPRIAEAERSFGAGAGRLSRSAAGETWAQSLHPRDGVSPDSAISGIGPAEKKTRQLSCARALDFSYPSPFWSS